MMIRTLDAESEERKNEDDGPDWKIRLEQEVDGKQSQSSGTAWNDLKS